MDTVYKDFVRDIVYALREKAAKLALQNKGGSSSPFDEGREFAFREVLSTLQNQAEVFGIELETICLDGFDALVGPLDLPDLKGPGTI